MSDDTDFEQPVRAIPPEKLTEIRDLLAKGAPLSSVFYRVRSKLPPGYTLRRFEQEAATPGTALSFAVEDGKGAFEANLSEKLWTQMEDGSAGAPRIIQEQRRQREIDLALAREFPALFAPDTENP